MINVLDEILGHIHALYFLKYEAYNKYVRSQYSFYDCINMSVELGLQIFKARNIIIDSKDPYAISSAILQFDQDEKIRNTSKVLGKGDEATMRKRGRKPKT